MAVIPCKFSFLITCLDVYFFLSLDIVSSLRKSCGLDKEDFPECYIKKPESVKAWESSRKVTEFVWQGFSQRNGPQVLGVELHLLNFLGWSLNPSIAECDCTWYEDPDWLLHPVVTVAWETVGSGSWSLGASGLLEQERPSFPTALSLAWQQIKDKAGPGEAEMSRRTKGTEAFLVGKQRTGLGSHSLVQVYICVNLYFPGPESHHPITDRDKFQWEMNKLSMDVSSDPTNGDVVLKAALHTQEVDFSRVICVLAD